MSLHSILHALHSNGRLTFEEITNMIETRNIDELNRNSKEIVESLQFYQIINYYIDLTFPYNYQGQMRCWYLYENTRNIHYVYEDIKSSFQNADIESVYGQVLQLAKKIYREHENDEFYFQNQIMAYRRLVQLSKLLIEPTPYIFTEDNFNITEQNLKNCLYVRNRLENLNQNQCFYGYLETYQLAINYVSNLDEDNITKEQQTIIDDYEDILCLQFSDGLIKLAKTHPLRPPDRYFKDGIY